MIRIHWLAGLCFTTGIVAVPQEFEQSFTGRTLRFDYYHSGIASEEHVSLDQIRQEGEWAGRRKHLLDSTNLGRYLFEVVDCATNCVIYSQGFSSIYGEWETTSEARDGVWRTFHESQRFPEPKESCQLVLKKRARDGSFRELTAHRVDPKSRFIQRSPIQKLGEWTALFENGAASDKVDLLVLGDGYTSAQRQEFQHDVERLMEVLFTTPPFSKRKSDFNVRAICVAADEAGVTDPRTNTFRNSPLGLSYNAFDSERYVLTYANRSVQEAAAQAPCDAMILLANSRKYGGGGIFRLWCTAAAKSSQAPYLVVHEFGHSFAGLADEYYTSQVAYEEFNSAGVEPWEPNVTALLDPSRLKWKDLANAPLPTPWSQLKYDEFDLTYQKKRQELRAQGASEETMEALFDEVKTQSTRLLQSEPHYGKVGAFEGALYEAKGFYRPCVDCIMFTRNPSSFCPVCSRAIERVIDFETGQ